jgi:hypothetical protein
MLVAKTPWLSTPWKKRLAPEEEERIKMYFLARKRKMGYSLHSSIQNPTSPRNRVYNYRGQKTFFFFYM